MTPTSGWKTWLTCGLIAVATFAATGHGQPRSENVETLPAPRVQARSESTSATDLLATWHRQALPIDLPTALRLAQTNNLDIARAEAVVAQAQAALQRARSLVLPSLTFGSTYLDHEGKIQQAVGNILDTNRNSLWVGG